MDLGPTKIFKKSLNCGDPVHPYKTMVGCSPVKTMIVSYLGFSLAVCPIHGVGVCHLITMDFYKFVNFYKFVIGFPALRIEFIVMLYILFKQG